MLTPRVLARIRNAPTRLFVATLTFGGMLGVPGLLAALGVVFMSLDLVAVGVALGALAFLVFVGSVVAAGVLIFQARDRLRRAETALYAGDFDAATREAHVVVRTVFRADYQMGALFTLALAAERLGAFADAGALFARALDMIPAFAAQRPGRRARALFSAHAAIDFAAAGDLARASAMLARCNAQLGPIGHPGALDVLLDDSALGAVGVNAILVELENRRDPRPLAVLASLLLAFKYNQLQQAMQLLQHEQASIAHGLAPHERALAERIHEEALRALTSGGGPHRSPAAALAPPVDMPSAWAALVVPRAS